MAGGAAADTAHSHLCQEGVHVEWLCVNQQSRHVLISCDLVSFLGKGDSQKSYYETGDMLAHMPGNSCEGLAVTAERPYMGARKNCDVFWTTRHAGTVSIAMSLNTCHLQPLKQASPLH